MSIWWFAAFEIIQTKHPNKIKTSSKLTGWCITYGLFIVNAPDGQL